MVLNNLKDTRAKFKVTQLELADATLTTRQTIHAIEKGKSIPSLELSLKIAGYFGMKIEELFQLKDQVTPFHDTDLFTVF